MRSFLFALALLPLCSLSGQINVGSRDSKSLNELKAEDLERLKNTTTIFVYRESDKETLELLKSTLEKACTYTTLRFVPYETYAQEKYGDSYSFFTIRGMYIERVGDISMTSTFLYLSLWMQNGEEPLDFCRIELAPTPPTYRGPRTLEHMYGDAVFRNWHLAFLKNALQLVDQKLRASETFYMRGNRTYGSLAPLQNDTLYVPDYVLIKFNPFTGDDSETHDQEKLFEQYPYPYKVVTTEELDRLVLEADSPIYYLCYIKSSSMKYICIFNGQSGEMLYSYYRSAAYNMEPSNFAEIAQEIKKAKN
jgi:hypothetical protein